MFLSFTGENGGADSCRASMVRLRESVAGPQGWILSGLVQKPCKMNSKHYYKLKTTGNGIFYSFNLHNLTHSYVKIEYCARVKEKVISEAENVIAF